MKIYAVYTPIYDLYICYCATRKLAEYVLDVQKQNNKDFSIGDYLLLEIEVIEKV